MKLKKNSWFNNPRTLIAVGLFVFGALFLLHKLTEYSRTIVTLSYSTFLDKVEEGHVREIRVYEQDVQGIMKDGTRFETVIAQTPTNWEALRKHGVKMVVDSPAGQFSIWYLMIMGLFIFALVMFWQFMRQMRGSGGSGGGGGNMFGVGKNKARMFMPATIKDRFTDVAGAAEAKEELKDIVDFLKNPKKYKKLGAKIPRGALLVGAPGNGKTLLARAVAGEANCPFFSTSGSDFIEVFVGVGAARVRDLFAQARAHAPCIIFIDEIDAVGRQRGSGLGGGNDEREQTLNQLLTEMDGFQTSEDPVIVLAATNRADVLDSALLRPGRFDRRIHVPYPDLMSREQILMVHAQSVKIDLAVDLKKIARGTPGFTGADLANLINEAAINATKNNKDKVTVDDFEEARDKMLLGKERSTILLTQEDRELTAYHEAGHALVRLLIPTDSDPLHKVTIVPRGDALGVTSWLPERDKYTESKEEMLSMIKTAAGGRAAEEIVFNKVTTGAFSDFNKATDIARKMVRLYGMSDVLGNVVYEESDKYSSKTAEIIDQEVRKIIDECHNDAKTLIGNNREMLNKLAQALLEKETLYAEEIYELLGITPRTIHTF